MCTCAPCVCLAPGSSTRATGALDCWAISPTEASYVLHWFTLHRWVRQTQVLSRPLLDYLRQLWDGLQGGRGGESWGMNWCAQGEEALREGRMKQGDRIPGSALGLCSPVAMRRAYQITACTILGVLQRLSERLWGEGVRKWWSNQGWDSWILGYGSNWELTFWVLRDRNWFKSIWSESSRYTVPGDRGLVMASVTTDCCLNSNWQPVVTETMVFVWSLMLVIRSCRLFVTWHPIFAVWLHLYPSLLP